MSIYIYLSPTSTYSPIEQSLVYATHNPPHLSFITRARVMLLALVCLLILSSYGKKMFSNIMFSNSAGCVCSADADMVDPAKVCKT